MNMNNNMKLLDRLEKFSSVISSCRCTDSSVNPIPVETALQEIIDALLRAKQAGNSVFLVGNGGSAGIASHAATDFLNVAKLKAFTLHDCSLATCMANDYGYENVFAQPLDTLAGSNDVLIAISSSGRSPNIVNAAAKAAEHGAVVFTLSGFNEDNPLRKAGSVNIWLESRDYGFVECGHAFILHNLADRLH
ncbi:MAG: SIS domain-containing protein [Gammaproteobacteria bacterium]|nr:SIS domain-containing protein [Gammaproteobacteria bacterium]